MTALIGLAEEVLQRLAWTSVQAAVLIAAVALLLRLAPTLSAAMRSALWWLVGAQLLLGLAWSHPVALPLLAPTAIEVVHRSPAALAMSDEAGPVSAPVAASTTHAAAPASTGGPALAWPLLALLAWLAGLAMQVPRTWRQWRQARAVQAIAAPLTDTALRERCQRQARALGLRRCPQLRQCDAITSPQVGGWLRPVVLLPARQALDAVEWDMAVAHELAHLARHDLWLGVVPVLAQRLFFFHPAVRWAMREYALHREAACDARVIRDHRVAPEAYGRLLLRLGVSHPLHAGLAGASPTFDNLRRRLLMLQQSVNESTPRTRGWLLVALVALAGVLPYRVTAGDAAAAAQAAAPAVPAAPAAAPAPTTMPPPPPPAPPAPAPPPPPPPPPPPSLAEYDGLFARHVYIDTTDQADGGFALLDDDSAVVTARQADVPAIKRLRKQSGSPLLWFRHDGKAYVSYDPATIAKARQAYAPVYGLAHDQGQLARAQGKLAGKQAGLAYRDAAFAREQAALARQQATLARESALAEAASASGTAMQVREAQQRALEAQQVKLEERHAAMKKAVASQQHDLEAQQAELERQQRALDQRQQQASRQAEQQMRQLLEQTIRDGKAQPVGA